MQNLFTIFVVSIILLIGCKSPQKETPSVSNDIEIDTTTTSIASLDTFNEMVVERENNIKIDQQSRLNHDEYSNLLHKYSQNGKVDYQGLKTEQIALKNYLKKLSNFQPDDSWSRNEQLAYWINLYNASTINLILDHYPVNSIKEINNGSPWSLKIVNVGDSICTLDELENKIIRPLFNDPRIHFALNCGARSCAPIPDRAFEGYDLNDQLNQQTKSFLKDELNSTNSNEIELSKVFDWYKEDFKSNPDSIILFLNKYMDTTINKDTKIKYKEYDWNLNN